MTNDEALDLLERFGKVINYVQANKLLEQVDRTPPVATETPLQGVISP